jgi:hypothetical protein
MRSLGGAGSRIPTFENPGYTLACIRWIRRIEQPCLMRLNAEQVCAQSADVSTARLSVPVAADSHGSISFVDMLVPIGVRKAAIEGKVPSPKLSIR